MADESILINGFGTGAIRRTVDYRDYDLAEHPQIVAAMPSRPASFSLRSLVTGEILNQGAEPSCVTFSSCHLQSIYESAERHSWLIFDGHGTYRALGGNGSNGIDTATCLKYMQGHGLPLLSNPSLTYRIQEYAYADLDRNFTIAVEAIKTAVSLGHPCVIALLLPNDFGSNNGNSSGSAVNSAAYHQICCIGYDDSTGRFEFLNSWGAGFGNGGFGTLPWAFLDRPEQNGYVYAFTTVDAPDQDVTPVPIPIPIPIPIPTPTPVSVGLSGKASGANLSALAVGQGYQLSGQGLIWPFEIAHLDIPNPLPDPDPNPHPNPDPDPHPGEIIVTAERAGIWVVVKLIDPNTGARLTGFVSATMNGQPYPVGRPYTTPQTTALLRNPAGSIIITGKASDGRQGTVTLAMG